MRKTVPFLFCLLILASCSHNEPAIVKVDTPLEDVKEEPELIEEVKPNEEIDEYIEFKLVNEVLHVKLKQIPILDAFLQATEDKQAVIENMNIQHIVHQNGNDVYLLEFSCQNEQCSYLLLDHNSENSGLLVADLAYFETFSLSPNGSKLMLKFNRVSTQDYPLSNIVIIHLDKWTFLKLDNELLTYNLFDFSWPILSANWIDEETISIIVPETLLTESESAEIDGIHYQKKEILFSIN